MKSLVFLALMTGILNLATAKGAEPLWSPIIKGGKSGSAWDSGTKGMQYCETATIAGRTGWRHPMIDELEKHLTENPTPTGENEWINVFSSTKRDDYSGRYCSVKPTGEVQGCGRDDNYGNMRYLVCVHGKPSSANNSTSGSSKRATNTNGKLELTNDSAGVAARAKQKAETDKKNADIRMANEVKGKETLAAKNAADEQTRIAKDKKARVACVGRYHMCGCVQYDPKPVKGGVCEK